MADRVYRAAEPGTLRVEALGDLTAIFDRRSMQTHLVIAPLPEILSALEGGPCNASALAERLAGGFDIEAEGDATAILADRLRELAAMGLVAPA